MKNTPYRKNQDFEVITKDKPFVNHFENRRGRRNNGGREFSNKAGIQMVVTKIGVYAFAKYRKILSQSKKTKRVSSGRDVSKKICHLTQC